MEMDQNISAPKDALPIRTGSNQRGMRNYNERLILETIRENGELSKADIAKMTQLSPQTATIIVNRLIKEGLLCKRKSIKGKVGQPRTPIALDPNGAYSFGVKVGRRSVEIFLVNFCHQIIDKRSLRYTYAEPTPIYEWLCVNIDEMANDLGPKKADRILGIGVAQPFELENWQEMIDAPEGTLEAWRGFDLTHKINQHTDLPTFLLNDASAACLAELSLHHGRSSATFLYIYLGTFIGGGIVVDGKLLEGGTGNAGGLASMPLNIAMSAENKPAQLLEVASFNSLELWASQNGHSSEIFDQCPLPADVQTAMQNWAEKAANGIAMAIIAGQAFFDMDYIVIDGSLPQHLMQMIDTNVQAALNNYDQRGISQPSLSFGQLGNNARALGAALLPFRANFSADETAFAIT